MFLVKPVIIEENKMTITELLRQEDGNYKCPYCNALYKGSGGLYQHIRFKHELSSKDVYDDLCKKDTDGICIICGRETAFRHGRYLLTCSAECKAEWYSVSEMRAQRISFSKRKYSTEAYIEKAKELHGDNFDYSLTHITTQQGRIEVICKKHGKFETVASYHLFDMCGGCKKCASESMVSTKLAWTDEKKEEVKDIRRRTNIKRYGNTAGPLPFGSQDYKDLIRERFGVDNPFASEIIKKKIRETNLAKYGVDNPAYLDKTIEASHNAQANKKRYKTHKKNNSFNKSKPEDEFHEFLLSIFAENDVFRNYADDPRYPFACDFYIKTLDLFIELNLYFTHGFHWFNENDPDDVVKLEKWKDRSNGKDLYSCAVNVWTVLDPLKRETAIQNNLNYVVLWNLEEIERYKDELLKRVIYTRINNLA